MNKPTISVLSATYNAEVSLRGLIASLRNQSDKDFRWFVADGSSTDCTLELLQVAKTDLDIVIDSRPDSGIYDALNRAVNLCPSDYYLVVGADDTLSSTAITDFRNAVTESDEQPDVVFSSWMSHGKVTFPRRRLGWLFGLRGIGSTHSVATLIRTSLHTNLGLYDPVYAICADQLFLKTAIRSGVTVVRKLFVAGEYGMEGYSAKDPMRFLTEFFQVQVQTERSVVLQIFLHTARLLKNFRRLKRTLVKSL